MGNARADFERQAKETRARIDATNERIEARTGRNLVSAIAIGVGLGALLIVSLVVVKALFMVMAAALAGLVALELARALRLAGRQVPRVPSVVAAVVIVPAAYFLDADGLWILALAGIALVVVWRLVEAAVARTRVPGPALRRDVGAAVLVQIYGPYLASFSVLLVRQDEGQWWVLAFLILAVVCDVGAYASGLAFGRHPMAPTISPKKTWEGFAGAAVAVMVAGALVSVLMLGQTWWFGVIFGAVILITATAGDLAESLIKRDIGIKDMSSWLPGHGGFLDRLDSILPSAVAGYVFYLIAHGL